MSTDPIPYRKDLRKKMNLEEENSENTNSKNESDKRKDRHPD